MAGKLIVYGLFVAVLLGVVAVIAFWPEDPAEGDAPEPQSDPHAAIGGADRVQRSFAKVHFMKKFVSALTSEPENMAPNPGYAPLLKDPEKPIACAACHDPAEIDIERMAAQDPGPAKVERFRRSPRFMVPLMEAWVDRLNEQHGDRLKKPVTCTDCHAIDPRDMEERARVYPALMVAFVNALKQPPTNEDSAPGWKPLLKDPATMSMLCAECHGETGVMLEQALSAGSFDLARPEPYADNKEFMVHLMERWVTRLNRDVGPLLRKAVVCIDCHDRDPRR